MTDDDRAKAAEAHDREVLASPEATGNPAAPAPAPAPKKGTDWWGEVKAIFTGFEESVRRMRELMDAAR